MESRRHLDRLATRCLSEQEGNALVGAIVLTFLAVALVLPVSALVAPGATDSGVRSIELIAESDGDAVTGESGLLHQAQYRRRPLSERFRQWWRGRRDEPDEPPPRDQGSTRRAPQSLQDLHNRLWRGHRLPPQRPLGRELENVAPGDPRLQGFLRSVYGTASYYRDLERSGVKLSRSQWYRYRQALETLADHGIPFRMD